MPAGDKSKYTEKQKRKAEHIEESYEQGGVKPKEAAERLRLHPFRAQKLAAQAEGFSDEDLDDAVVRLAELDGALKGQSRLAPDLELQRTLVDLTRRPGVVPASGRAS